jgi:hypothetical protein
MTSWVDTTLHDYFKVVKAEPPKATSQQPLAERTQARLPEIQEQLLEGQAPLFERQEQLLERQEQVDLLTMAWHQHCAGYTLDDIPLENGWIPPRVDIVPIIRTQVKPPPKADARIVETFYADFHDPHVVEVRLSNGIYMWRCMHPSCTYISKRRYHAQMHYERIHEKNGKAVADKREYYLYEKNGQMLCGRCPWYRRTPVACRRYSLTAVAAVATTVHPQTADVVQVQPAVVMTDVIQVQPAVVMTDISRTQKTVSDVIHAQSVIPDLSFLGPFNKTKDGNYRAPCRFIIRTTRGLRVPDIENGADGVVYEFGGYAK